MIRRLPRKSKSFPKGHSRRLLPTTLFQLKIPLQAMKHTKSLFLVLRDAYPLTSHRLCLILTLMTLVIFVINIVQARLLEYITHPAWIIGLPAILFAFFLLWVVNHIRGNPDAFLPHCLDFRKRVRHAAMHIHAIKKDQEHCEPEPKKCMHHRTQTITRLISSHQGQHSLHDLGLLQASY